MDENIKDSLDLALDTFDDAKFWLKMNDTEEPWTDVIMPTSTWQKAFWFLKG